MVTGRVEVPIRVDVFGDRDLAVFRIGKIQPRLIRAGAARHRVTGGAIGLVGAFRHHLHHNPACVRGIETLERPRSAVHCGGRQLAFVQRLVVVLIDKDRHTVPAAILGINDSVAVHILILRARQVEELEVPEADVVNPVRIRARINVNWVRRGRHPIALCRINRDKCTFGVLVAQLAHAVFLIIRQQCQIVEREIPVHICPDRRLHRADSFSTVGIGDDIKPHLEQRHRCIFARVLHPVAVIILELGAVDIDLRIAEIMRGIAVAQIIKPVCGGRHGRSIHMLPKDRIFGPKDQLPCLVKIEDAIAIRISGDAHR